ncbi:50S ribosomal protein L9 [Hydrogenivirga sp. 128-5-R1-1]|uniref:50S ribosomal protein L9 n=1 Tax=Hydrogenivirga sp. 128-5-R1-1 TaxID=392423 RepID=UPI00015F2758|nr:50S ribosomal protein L9 [Hydrogenivirga sp. 128-5-R1-1]EDP74242.1 ribosomal protein L09 [Hydrogenivirga sp. 128-5-R1-1]
MKVILVKDVEGWGTLGDVIDVKPGFARNYLIPQGLAYPATDNYIKHVQEILRQKSRKLEREKEKAQKLAEQLDGLEIEIERPVGPTGKMYGSVSSTDIVNTIKEKTDIELDKKKVMLRNPIRDLGAYNITLRLHPEVSAKIKLHVIPQQQ